jgi:hypothetical protein
MAKPATRYPLGVAVFCMNDSTPIVAAAEHDRVMGEIADELMAAGDSMVEQRRTIQRLAAECERLREALRTVVGLMHHKATTPLERESIRISEAALAGSKEGE